MSYIFAILSFILTAGSLEAGTFKVMQYNTENFFDTTFDEGTDDFTYLPLAVKKTMPGHAEKCRSMGQPYSAACLNLDWNENIFESKIKNIAQVIRAFDDTGMGPDIVVMQEIENINVLNQLVDRGLQGMGFKHIALIEGDDTRGIDIGVISKYPITSSRRYSIFLAGKKLNTRGITEVSLKVNDINVVVFGNHWPSQNNPASHRIESAKVLEKASVNREADLIVAMGDFNTLPKDSPYPYAYLNSFTDTEIEARKLNQKLNPGTHYFRGEWSSLDKIFVHKNSKIKTEYSTFDIIVRPFKMKTDPKTGDIVPRRFEPKSGKGYSDHLPLGVSFSY